MEAQDHEQSSNAQRSPGRSAKRMLILEDNDDIRFLLAEHFKAQGFEVRDCATGSAGIREGLDFDPEIGLFDIDLPDISGREALGILVKVRSRPLKSIFLSSFVDRKAPVGKSMITVDGVDYPAVSKDAGISDLMDLIQKMDTNNPLVQAGEN